MKKIKCYHFCKKKFYDELLRKKIIIANKYISQNDLTEKLPEHYVKDYVFINKNINNGMGMFFAWSNHQYKGKTLFDDNGEYYLLEILTDEKNCIKTHYENWCSFGMDLYENNGDLHETDIYCKEEFGIIDGLNGSYNAIYDISNTNDEIQILLPYINLDDVKSAKRCLNKFV